MKKLGGAEWSGGLTHHVHVRRHLGNQVQSPVEAKSKKLTTLTSVKKDPFITFTCPNSHHLQGALRFATQIPTLLN